MAQVGIIVVSYRTDPRPLFASILTTGHEIRWYLFVHGQDSLLRSHLDAFAAANNSRYFPYGVNRGLARSWNEGVAASLADGNEATLIVNDDLFFYDGGFDAFVDFVLAESRRVPDFGLVMLYGMEPRQSTYSGSAAPEQLKQILTLGACFALGRGAVEKIGYFDENFWPAYFEDFDYHYRLGLAGVPLLRDKRALLQHQRSATIRHDRFLSLLHPERLRRCEAYYIRKWGGRPDHETFVSPFNDRNFDYYIAEQRSAAPYGADHARADLAAAATAGFLEFHFGEELLGILARHQCSMGRYLEWSGGEGTAILAEYARMRSCQFFLSIDDSRDRLRRTAASVPRYPFLHFRFIESTLSHDVAGDAEFPYVSYPLGLTLRFDVILVAGRWRIECALTAARSLAEGGLMIVCNEERASRRALRRQLRQRGDADGAAALGDWDSSGRRALAQVYEVVEDGGRFLVLRPKRRQTIIPQQAAAG
jgi:hypothetical protein